MMKIIKNGSVTSPSGFKASGISAGIKSNGSLDIALIVSDFPAVYVGAYTANKFAAAPVIYCRQCQMVSDTIKAIIINSGNANACTGKQGLENAHYMAQKTAQCLSCKPDQVLVSSTGRIGEQLPLAKILNGIKIAAEKLSDKGGIDAAKAIMTTDRTIKSYAVSIDIEGVKVIIGGIAKGAGMIAPELITQPPHATMLSYITTDALIDRRFFMQSLDLSLDKSFNRISVDGDMSTNDTFIAMANGAAGNSIITTDDQKGLCFREAFNQVAAELAKMIVLDGEGATKFVEITVKNARSVEQAHRGAMAIANSLLCKTAWFGADPNWGRILDVLGYCDIDLVPEKVNLFFDNVQVVKEGCDAGTPLSKKEDVLKRPSFTILIDLGIGFSQFTAWTCDINYDYVKLNAEYRT